MNNADIRKVIGKVIAGAISDPGATQGHKGGRTLTEWQTDAVLAALSPSCGNESMGEK